MKKITLVFVFCIIALANRAQSYTFPSIVDTIGYPDSAHVMLYQPRNIRQGVEDVGQSLILGNLLQRYIINEPTELWGISGTVNNDTILQWYYHILNPPKLEYVYFFLYEEKNGVIRAVDSILMSVRRTGARGYSVSADDGQTWSGQGTWPEMTVNACNGEMLRIDDTTILHSITHSMQRENVSIFISHDEGATWRTPVSLFQGPSVYSSLTLLDDGTIGAFVELNPDGPCELWYMNFNMRWLLEHQSHQ